MPMYVAISMFLLTLMVTGVAAVFNDRLRAGLFRATAWIVIAAAAAGSSAFSALVSNARHAGTGFTTSYGWPKPFYFRHLSETGEISGAWSPIYFVGNVLLFASVMLLLWTGWRFLRR